MTSEPWVLNLLIALGDSASVCRFGLSLRATDTFESLEETPNTNE